MISGTIAEVWPHHAGHTITYTTTTVESVAFTRLDEEGLPEDPDVVGEVLTEEEFYCEECDLVIEDPAEDEFVFDDEDDDEDDEWD
jgi:hypothetical protein